MIFSDSPQQRALERMMTAVPKFRPKGGGIMVLHRFEYTADIVSYHNLTPGKEYVVKGTLMNKTSGKPVTVNDEHVTAETAFTPETRDGEVKVTFTFNSYVITETTDVVVFESLYREEVEITVHADIEDEGQSVKVYVPEDHRFHRRQEGDHYSR